MNWAAWGPTIVSAIIMIFTAGMLVQRQSNQEKRLDDHDELHKETVAELARVDREHAAHLARVDIALVRLERYNEGFTDATKLMGSHAGS